MKHLRISLKHWCLAGVVCIAVLAASEMLFRTEAIWRGPLGAVLMAPTDVNTRAVWLSYQPPSSADRHVMLLGASTALASMELPNQGTSRMFTEKGSQGIVEFRCLCIGGANYAEYLTVAENALEHGYRPDLVIVFTGPGMLTDEDALKARRHTRFLPLVSTAWLNALERLEPNGVRQKLHHWVLSNSAVVRHRYYVNNWMRRRFGRALRRQDGLVLKYDETRYRNARSGPLEADVERFERVSSIPRLFRPDATSEAGLVPLLAFFQDKNIRTILVEAPRSPPVRQLYEPIKASYASLMNRFAQQYGTSYVDPNEQLYLEVDEFADLYHVSWKGRTRWLEALVPTLAKLIA